MGEIYENLVEDVTPEVNDSVRLVTSSGDTKKSTVSKLAETMFEEDTGVDYDTNAQTVKGAINELKDGQLSVSVSGHTLVIS